MKAFSFFLLTLLISSQIIAQPVSQQWVTRYNGTSNSNDYCYSMVLDPSLNIIVAGYSTNVGTSKDMTTVKYDQTGGLVWARTFDGPNHGGDYAFAVTTDQAGNVYTTGRCDGGATNADITTLKYDASGVPLWSAVYDGPAHYFDEARCIGVDNAGNVFVAGSSMGVSSDYDLVLIKYNSDGVQQWVQRYNGPGNNYDGATSMVLNSTGDIYITGESIGAGTGADYVTLKYNTDGVQQWIQRYNGPGNGGDIPVSIKLDGAENVYVTGESDGGATLFDYATIKYSSAGVPLWTRRYDSPASTGDFATAMTVSNSGNVYVTGITVGVASTLDSNFATVKYNTDGDLQWVRNYQGQNNSSDVPRAICLDNQENIYVAGTSALSGSFNDYVTIKYDMAGSQIWIQSYNGPANADDYSSSIAADNIGDVFVTGRSMGVTTAFDFATVKYSPLVGIQPLSNQIPSKFKLGQNYPNPFNPSTKVKFDIPVSSYVSVKVYDVSGKIVLDPLEQSVSPGSYEFTIDASKLASGVYFYNLKTNGFTDTKTMVLIK